MLAILRVAALGFASVPRLYTTTPFEHAVYGSGAVVCDLRGTNPLVYVQMAADTWTALADVSSGSDYSVAVPEGCRPFDHVFLSYAVGSSHPPWDGRQFLGGRPGGYGTPHVDVHFVKDSVAERESLTSECAWAVPGPVNAAGEPQLCNISATDAATRRFFALPPPDLTVGFQTVLYYL